MREKTTELSKCKEVESYKSTTIGRIKKCVIQLVKVGLRYFLLRPKTWQWLMVYLPEFFDKVEVFLKDFIKSFESF